MFTPLNFLSLPDEILLHIVRQEFGTPSIGLNGSPGMVCETIAPAVSLVNRRLRQIAVSCFEEFNQQIVNLDPTQNGQYQKRIKAGTPSIVLFLLLMKSMHDEAKRLDSEIIPPHGFTRLQWECDNYKFFIVRVEQGRAAAKKIAPLKEAIEELNLLLLNGPNGIFQAL